MKRHLKAAAFAVAMMGLPLLLAWGICAAPEFTLAAVVIGCAGLVYWAALEVA